jgi:type IV secretion system protein VirD4
MEYHNLRDRLSQGLIDQSYYRYGRNIPQYMLHDKREDTGFFFGTGPFGNHYIGKPEDHDGHILVVGGAGSGKSTCIAIPTLKTWKGAILAIDIKGELTDRWNEIDTPNRPAKIFNLTKDEGIFSSYDPFHFLKHDDEFNLVQNAREIAHAIIPLPLTIQEPFWIQSAQHVLTATLLYGFIQGISFNAIMSRILTTPIWGLIAEIEDKAPEVDFHIKQFSGIENPADNKMLTGISAELNNKVIGLAANLPIKKSFTPAENSINWDDLESHNIFMRVPEDKLGQYDGALTLMITQLIRSLERRKDKQFTLDGKPKVLSANGNEIPPTLLLLDEFPRLGKIDVIQNAVSTLRSKGVTICLMMQSLAQLDRIYGVDTRKIIVDNCQYKAILNVTDPGNQKIFSDMAGTIVVPTAGVTSTETDSVLNDSSVSEGFQLTETREPSIHPHEFACLSNDMVLMTPEGYCRVNKAPYYNENKNPTKKHRNAVRAIVVTKPLDTHDI